MGGPRMSEDPAAPLDPRARRSVPVGGPPMLEDPLAPPDPRAGRHVPAAGHRMLEKPVPLLPVTGAVLGSRLRLLVQQIGLEESARGCARLRSRLARLLSAARCRCRRHRCLLPCPDRRSLRQVRAPLRGAGVLLLTRASTRASRGARSLRRFAPRLLTPLQAGQLKRQLRPTVARRPLGWRQPLPEPMHARMVATNLPLSQTLLPPSRPRARADSFPTPTHVPNRDPGRSRPPRFERALRHPPPTISLVIHRVMARVTLGLVRVAHAGANRHRVLKNLLILIRS